MKECRFCGKETFKIFCSRQCKEYAKRNKYYLENYNINLTTYYNILQEQQGVCAICHSWDLNNKPLAVDHNHKTGKVRGLLCSRCNTAIGLFDENEGFLVNAVFYLNKYKN